MQEDFTGKVPLVRWTWQFATRRKFQYLYSVKCSQLANAVRSPSLVSKPVERLIRLDKRQRQKALMALGCLLQEARTIPHRLIVQCSWQGRHRYAELVITKWWQNTDGKRLD